VQGEGREWPTLASKETFALFDYLFTDAMTFPDRSGKRLRLWMKDELGPITDREEFMKLYMERALGILNEEPIDIFVSPTYIPEILQPAYEEIWTAERMSRIIEAAKKNDVAIELNNRYNIPNAAFVKLGQQAGVKFTFGSNNANRDIGRLEYPIKLAKECGLRWQDFWIPKPDGEKAIQRKPA
jgi:histidinol phosphatase-like PHP family hydrolase